MKFTTQHVFLLAMLKISCSKVHYQKGFNLILSSYKIAAKMVAHAHCRP